MTLHTERQARQQGFAPLTMPYGRLEEAMLLRALADLAGCSVILVAAVGGTEIWRHRQELVKEIEQKEESHGR